MHGTSREEQQAGRKDGRLRGGLLLAMTLCVFTGREAARVH